MPKPSERSYSRIASEAILLLGHMIRAGRIERQMTTQNLAERAGISRALLYRIEKGDPACSVGAVFETAAIVGVQLFKPQAATMTGQLDAIGSRLALLPKVVRTKSKAVKDDF
jgi:DNA-binding XRE family transcriptional regulator